MLSRAGLLAASDDGRIPAGSRVVCTITGNGLKDPDWALSGAPAQEQQRFKVPQILGED